MTYDFQNYIIFGPTIAISQSLQFCMEIAGLAVLSSMHNYFHACFSLGAGSLTASLALFSHIISLRQQL